MLQEDKRKKGKAEKYKQRKKEEQERKKIERDKKKKMEEDVGVVERSGKSKDTEISESTSTSDDDTGTIPAQVLDSDCETETASRPFSRGNFLSDTGPIVRMMVFSSASVSSMSQTECHPT